MDWLVAIALIVFACFCVVLFFGAPYLPTLAPQVEAAMNLAGLKPGQTMLELGCGDGRVLVAAAKQGFNVVGYELNPLLVLVAYARTRRYRRQVRVVWGDFWRAKWPPAEAVFTFLLPKYMSKLDTQIAGYQQGLGRPVRLVSFAFKVPGRKAGRRQNGVYMYLYD